MSATMPSGTVPASEYRAPVSGRFALVRGELEHHLYLPEAQELYTIPANIQQELQAYVYDNFDDNLPDAKTDAPDVRSFFESFARRNAPPSRPAPSQAPGIRDLVLNISQICNLGCTYCYADELNKAGRTMLPETCRAAIDKAYDLSSNGLSSIKFLGGEPTLAFREICSTVDYVRHKCRSSAYALPSFVIVTNGTKLTDQMIDFFVEHNFYVLVSLDGPKDVHDKLRPFLGGRGSYDSVLSAISRFHEKDFRVAVESVYTQTHYDNGVTVEGLVDHLLDLGLREMQVTLALGAWHGENAHEQIAEVANSFASAARACIRSFSSDDPHLLRGIQFVIDGFFNRHKNEHVCGAGRTFMAVNFDGEAFPCYLLESPETSYGFVNGAWSDETYRKISSSFYRNGKAYHDVCGKCWANEICQSCLGSTYLLEKKVAKPPAWFCAVQKTMIAAVLGEIGDKLSGDDRRHFIAGLEKVLSPRTFEKRQ